MFKNLRVVASINQHGDLYSQQSISKLIAKEPEYPTNCFKTLSLIHELLSLLRLAVKVLYGISVVHPIGFILLHIYCYTSRRNK